MKSGPGIRGNNQFNDDDDDDGSDYEGEDEEDDFDDYADGQSTIKTTGYKSVAYLDQKKKGKVAKKPPGTSFHGTTSITLPYILDEWLGNNTQKHVSIQIQLLTGNTASIQTRVSSDQKSLVVKFPMTKYLSSSSHAFVPYVLARDQHKKNEEAQKSCTVALTVHPKTYARQKSVSVIKNRDPSKVIFYEQRIPLPFACMHEYSTSIHDNYFYGENKVHYQDSSVHLQVELIADIGDCYVAEAESLIASLHVNDFHVCEESKIPGNISVSASGKYNQRMDLESIASFYPENETIKSAAASRRSMPCKDPKKRLAMTISDRTVG